MKKNSDESGSLAAGSNTNGEINTPNHPTSNARSGCFSGRCLGHIPTLRAPQQQTTTRTTTEYIAVVGGATSLAVRLYENNTDLPHIGIMIAGNAGRPCGACGGVNGRIQKLHAGHRTQEEDVISCWFLTECQGSKQYNQLYQDTLDGLWGLVDRTGTSQDTKTIQGIDYVHSTCSKDYAKAWYVRYCSVSRKLWDSRRRRYKYDLKGARAPCDLIFVAGPNAGASNHPTGSTARTKSVHASSKHEYVFFKESVKCAVRTGLDAMIEVECDIALVTMVSCGIYAGPHRERINNEFIGMVNDLLVEEMSVKNEMGVVEKLVRGRCFKRVIIPLLCTCGEQGKCAGCRKSMRPAQSVPVVVGGTKADVGGEEEEQKTAAAVKTQTKAPLTNARTTGNGKRWDKGTW